MMTARLRLAAFVVLLLGACKPKASPPSPDASTAAPSSTAVPAKPALPPEPAPPVADKADQVPGFEATLAKDAAYQAVWTSPRPALNAFLTYVSELLAEGSASTDITTVVAAKKLEDAAIKLFLIFSRVGRFPADFTTKFASHREGVKGEPHLGTWSPWNKGEPIHDFTALAAWSMPEDGAYLRERMGAKRLGPTRWAPLLQTSTRPWLVSGRAATERLALLLPLEPSDCTPLRQFQQRIDPQTGAMRGECVPRFSEKETDLRPVKDGTRVNVASPDYEMTDDECAEIIKRVRPKAGAEGAVYVSIPIVNDRPEDHAGTARADWSTDAVLCLDVLDGKLVGKGVQPGAARTTQANINRKRLAELAKAR